MKKDRVQSKLIKELEKVPIVSVACRRSGVSRNSFYRWCNEDPYFASLINDALIEGEDFINDLSESQLITLIKEKKFSAIRFWLTHRHSKFKKQEREISKKDDFDSEMVIKTLGLTDEDFKDENLKETTNKITDHLLNL
ncbi:hypothetical protein KKH36_00460 [Patescibacteria group bacterium]|nr:hypothetical protein [Patescibacteria group bacterium]